MNYKQSVEENRKSGDALIFFVFHLTVFLLFTEQRLIDHNATVYVKISDNI